MKTVSLSNVEARGVSHDPHILKQVLLAAGEIPGLTQLARATFGAGQSCAAHRHPDLWEVFLVESGRGDVRVNGRPIRLEPGVCVVVEPGEEHALVNTGLEPLVLTYFGVAPPDSAAEGGAAEKWIRRLGLRKHPEGGWYREIYRSGETVAAGALPGRYGGPRCFSTQIHYLLESGDFSAFHRLRSDEVWHFHTGSAVALHMLRRDGSHARLALGSNPDRGEVFQVVAPAGDWFAAEVEAPASFALAGCTVAPGFEFTDFEIASRRALCEQYPQQEALVRRLTRA